MMEKRVVNIEGEEYNFNIYTERRRSFRCSILNGGINIRVPRHVSKEKREKEISNFMVWAIKKIRSKPQKVKKDYEHGDYFKTHSRIYKLHIEERVSQKNFTKLTGSTIEFKIANHHEHKVKQKYISKQLQKLLAKHHLDELKEHVHRINSQHFGKEINKISYKYTRSRWGCCKTQTNEVDFSTKLLLAPLEVLEYVIVHELAHLTHANHSKRFWRLVESIDPNYKEKVKWLNKHGELLSI